MEEQWRKIPNVEYYEISNLGRVRSLDRVIVQKNGKEYIKKGRILKNSNHGNGYYKVSFRIGDIKSAYVHRLVAMAFIPNPENKPCINHIDNDPSNNRADNLEWVTKQENTDWMIKQGRNKRTAIWLKRLHETQKKDYKPVCGTNIKTGKKIHFESINATKNAGYQPSSVCMCCKHLWKQHKGYTWEYLDEIKKDKSV